jgi:outer membrane translocation and assembly module TamA
VRVHTEAAGPEVLDVVVTLETAPPRTINVGFGYWTTDKLRVEAAWRHRNLLRAGRGVGIDGAYSRYEQSAGVQLWKPVLFHSRTRGSLALRGRRESEENYELRAGDLELGAIYLATLTTSWGATLGLSVFDLEERTDDADRDDPGPNLVWLSLQWTHDTLDDRLVPRSGMLSRIDVETGLPSFDTVQRYALLSPQVSGFLPGPGGTVFAARTTVGFSLRATEAGELLANKRYYAGGSGSMRGYERRLLGPRDSQGRPSGGVAKLELSTEFRVPLFWRLSGAAFVDAAQVWADRSSIRLDELEVAAGPGLLVTTPVGPVRIDVGFPVTAKPMDQPDVVYHLSVGQVF